MYISNLGEFDKFCWVTQDGFSKWDKNINIHAKMWPHIKNNIINLDVSIIRINEVFFFI